VRTVQEWRDEVDTNPEFQDLVEQGFRDLLDEFIAEGWAQAPVKLTTVGEEVELEVLPELIPREKVNPFKHHPRYEKSK
jgi:hypothetical protein